MILNFSEHIFFRLQYNQLPTIPIVDIFNSEPFLESGIAIRQKNWLIPGSRLITNSIVPTLLIQIP